jgi:hypothetical protein
MSFAGITSRSVDNINGLPETTYLPSRSVILQLASYIVASTTVQHKMHVQAAVAGAREELMKELYILNQRNGLFHFISIDLALTPLQVIVQTIPLSRVKSDL